MTNNIRKKNSIIIFIKTEQYLFVTAFTLIFILQINHTVHSN